MTNRGVYAIGFDEHAQCVLIAFRSHCGDVHSHYWLWPEDALKFIERTMRLPERIRPILARKCQQLLDSLIIFDAERDPGDEDGQ
jgi:hypothetical protein